MQIQSKVLPDGHVEISLVDVETPVPSGDEVVVRIEATPLNPSDLGTMFARADPTSAMSVGTAELPALRASIPEAMRPSMAARVGIAIPAGNEGAGTVIAAGASMAAQALLGKTVAIVGGGTYARHRKIAAAQCLVLPEGTTAEQGASNFVNPMTALAMLATMRRDGHTALVHTAAASNLGQMLVKLCLADGVPLVNVVRRKEHAEVLRAIGATHVVDSSADDFDAALERAIAETGATLAFDAVAGGDLSHRILTAMERVQAAVMPKWSPYGSTVHKQVYLYGVLDHRPTELRRTYGMAWGVGGWLVSNVLARLGADEVGAMRARIARELTSTFASHYTARLSLHELLMPEHVARYARLATGEKYLVTPAT